jgi:hypothetical protein
MQRKPRHAAKPVTAQGCVARAAILLTRPAAADPRAMQNANKSNIPRFLNRLLGLSIPEQQVGWEGVSAMACPETLKTLLSHLGVAQPTPRTAPTVPGPAPPGGV